MHEAATDPASPALVTGIGTSDGDREGTLDVLRDIVRGGLAGLIVGVLVAGIGGRLVMRLAALLVPAADGAFTENGNRIGDITIGGSLALVVFIGLFFGALAGSLWVTVQPWLPRSRGLRILASIPLALALGTMGLIEPHNPDFRILGRDPFVIASLLGLVALVGPMLVAVDHWLDGRLPRPRASDRGTIGVYIAITAVGALLTVLGTVPTYLSPRAFPVGVALLATGVATLVWWAAHVRGMDAAPWVRRLGRIGVAAVVVAGFAISVPDVLRVLGLR